MSSTSTSFNLLTNKTRLFLLVLTTGGFTGTWLLLTLNGALSLLYNCVVVKHALPGVNEPLIAPITGSFYSPIDHFFRVLIVFFWQAVDGSHPSTTLFGIWFASQHLGTVAVVYLISLRQGKTGWKYSPTLWLVLFQFFAIASAGPFYVLQTLEVAMALKDQRVSKDALAATTLPLSLLIGYVVPTFAMGLPSPNVVSVQFQQRAVAMWQVYPLVIAASQWIIGYLVQVFRSRVKNVVREGTKEKREEFMKGNVLAETAIQNTARKVSLLCFAFHSGAILLLASRLLFASVFSIQGYRMLDWHKLIKPIVIPRRVESMGEGALQFMQWDVLFGSICMIFLVGKLMEAKRGNAIYKWLSFGFCSALLGPGYVISDLFVDLEGKWS